MIQPFNQLLGQPVAAEFLSAVADSPYLTQAFLFVGPLGAGKTEAAEMLAKVLLCANGGDDDCDSCRQVKGQTHPDLQIMFPEGASGYLAEQMQQLIRTAMLAPIRSTRKVYIINLADRMSSSFANAFLKILEEPPPSVVFILIARSSENIPPTVRSRCQMVPFSPIPETMAIELLSAELGLVASEARVALAYSAGSLNEARDFLRLTGMRELKRQLMTCLQGLLRFDSLDIINAAKQLVVACKVPLDELRASQDRRLEEGRQTLSKSAITTLEQRLKREMTAAERSSVRWIIHAVRVWLHDILLVSEGNTSDLINIDSYDLIALYAEPRLGLTRAITQCLQAAFLAEDCLDYNVSVQSIFEYLLFTIRDELGEPT